MTGAALPAAELRALLALRSLPGLGDRKLAALLRRHGAAEAVAALPASALGCDTREISSPRTLGRVERARALIGTLGLQVWAVHAPGYPEALRELPDPPAVLMGRGDPGLLVGLSVAVVGTRRPTDYGVGATELLVSGLVRAGVVIWSGLARGVDGVAHRTALECGGATVAVLGSGIDVPYPREHAGLLEEIARTGLVLSEFLPGEPPLAHHFPRRNRIIASLAGGVLVVEARPDGGALITAEAGSGSRPIMAVPGPIGWPTSVGPNRLIQDGAKLVMEVADVLEEIGGPLNAEAARGRPSARRRWTRAEATAGRAPDPAQLSLAGQGGRERRCGPAPPAPGGGEIAALLAEGGTWHVDEIANRCGIPAGAVLARLLELEIAGLAEQLAGKRFRLAARPDPGRHIAVGPGN